MRPVGVLNRRTSNNVPEGLWTHDEQMTCCCGRHPDRLVPGRFLREKKQPSEPPNQNQDEDHEEGPTPPAPS